MSDVANPAQQNARLFQTWQWMKKDLAQRLSTRFPALFMWWSEAQQEEEVPIGVRGRRVVPAPSRTYAGMAHIVKVDEHVIQQYVEEFETLLQKLMLEPRLLRRLHESYQLAHTRRPETIRPTRHGFRSLGAVTGAVVDVQGGCVAYDRTVQIELNDWDLPEFEVIFKPLPPSEEREAWDDVREQITQEQE